MARGDRLGRPARVALVLAVLAVLVLCVYLMRFARPVSDDFHRAADPRVNGLSWSIRHDYLHLSGRWLSTTLHYTKGRFFELYRSYRWVHVSRWTTDGGLWLATVLLLLCTARLTPHPKWLFAWMARRPAALIAVWVAVMGAGFYVPAWALGNPIPARSINAVYCFFLTGWFMLALTLAMRYRQVDLGWVKRPAVAAGVELAFAAALVLGPNVSEGLIDAVRLGPQYARESDQRHQIAQAAAARGPLHLVLPPIHDWPRLSQPADMDDNPTFWRNVGFASYHGLKTVVVDSRLGRSPAAAASAAWRGAQAAGP